MKRLFKRFRRARGPRKTIEAYFDRGRLLCPQCGTEFAHDGLQPLSFVPCPSCGFSEFVPLRLGEFLLFEPAGAGGMASVYKAYHRRHPGDLYAVKILSDKHRENPESIAAFVTEAELHGAVPPHPHIVPYVSHGCVDGWHYYAMTFVVGDRLIRLLEDQGKLAEPDALRWFEQVLDAIIHIRDSGILYRDVNAANVIIDPDGNAVMLDFGLSLPLEEAARPKGPIKHVDGTAEYMPPERLRGEPEDERSVIYSLGLLLFHLLTGELLVKGQTLTATAKRHVSGLRLAGTSAPLSNVSDAAMGVIEATVQPDPGQRFQTLEDVLRAVQAARAACEDKEEA